MKRRILYGVVAVLAIGLLFVLPLPAPKHEPQLGFTYSIGAAKYLQIDPEEAFQSALDELKPAVVRLPFYWTEVEPQEGIFDWTSTDRQMAMLQERGIKAIVAVGHKLPRWPECHIPAWLDQADTRLIEEELRSYLWHVVERYKNHEALLAWQVENESLFPFGDCPSWSRDFGRLKREISLVKSWDPGHPVYTSDSGELSLWWRSAALPIDGLGISVYRSVYSKGSIFRWPVNPYYYRVRRWLIQPFVPRFMVSELQTEPWGSKPLAELDAEEIRRSFPPQDLAKRVDYASRLGAETVLTWGVEWWYFMREQGDDSYWNAAISVFQAARE